MWCKIRRKPWIEIEANRYSTRQALIFLTDFTVKFGAEAAVPSVFGNHPRAQLEWWAMTHVLPMAAFEVCHPIVEFIAMKADNPALHSRNFVRIARSRRGQGANQCLAEIMAARVEFAY
jgi:hypothetical protein